MYLKKNFSQLFSYLATLVLFIVLGFIYFYPVIQGKSLFQQDDLKSRSVAKELIDYEEETGEKALWTNSMFSGMPAYQIKGGDSDNMFLYLSRFLRFGLPYTTVAILFTYLLGFYVLLISLKLGRWLSLAGAISFAFASYNLIIIVAGHITKAYAIAYMAPVIAGVLLIYDKKYIWGAILTIFALGLQIVSSHVQITYYLMLTIVIMIIVKFIYALKNKQLRKFFIASAVAGGAALLAVLPNTASLWTTYEYGQETIRGKSELTPIVEKERAETGLDKDYALSWSYGISETMTIFIPDFKGGGSTKMKEGMASYEMLKKLGVAQPEKAIPSVPTYWGDMPFTVGPVYFGAIVIFLFLLGLLLVEGPERWWLLAATILSFFLAWGKHFGVFTDFFFYNVPLYNKFRTVSMALVVANVTMPILGFMALKRIINNELSEEKIKKALMISTSVLGGIALIFAAIPGAFFDFTSMQDPALIERFSSSFGAADLAKQFFQAVVADRESILRADSFRSLVFVLLAAGIVWLLMKKKMKSHYLIGALAFAILVDLWVVDLRYVAPSDFQDKAATKSAVAAQPSDQYILADKSHFRVFKLGNPFNDGFTSYFHKSIGGYHGAKLRRYQDFIERELTPNLQSIYKTFGGGINQNTVDGLFQKLNGLRLLNCKYIIYSPKAEPLMNESRCGNAWFVDSYKIVENADAEILQIRNIDPKREAVVDKRFEDILKTVEFGAATQTDTIYMTEYKPDAITYKSKSTNGRLALFSEVYYPHGWEVTIDGKPVDHVRADYVIRGLPIPAGEHEIKFEFNPKSHKTGNIIALTTSILICLILLGAVFISIKECKLRANEEEIEKN